MSETNGTARDLLGAWALDAVDDAERAAVERAIAGDEELAAEARELRETVAQLAEGDAEPPPPHLRDAVLAQIREEASGDDDAARQRAVAEECEDLARIRRRRRWQALAAAAAVVVAVAIPTGVAVNQADRADQAEQQAADAQQQATDAQQQSGQIAEALMDPAAEMVSEDLPDGSRAVAVLGEDSALFTAQGMTELHEQDYQLWTLQGEEATSAGVLDWEDGELTAHVEQFPADAALAVTAEPVGGSEQPTSDPLVVLGGPDS